MRRRALATTLLTASASLTAAESCTTLDPKAVAALFDDWNFALSSLEASQVVQRYWANAVLLPTVSNTPRTNAAMIGDYFEHFLARRPRGRIDTRTINTGCNVAMDVGTYTFSLMDSHGSTSEVAARYSFVYQYRDGAWKILHHHSSAMPESAGSVKPADQHSTVMKPAEAQKPAQVVHTSPPPPATPSRPKEASKPPPKAPPQTAAAATLPVKTPAVEARTALFANLASSPPPSKFYPAEAAKNKERGHVNLKVCTDGAGTISDAPEIAKSSGSKLLDEAALAWARAAKWVPATVNRQRVEGCTEVDVAFEAAASA